MSSRTQIDEWLSPEEYLSGERKSEVHFDSPKLDLALSAVYEDVF